MQFDFTHINGKSYQIINKTPGTVIQPETVKTIKGLGFVRDTGASGASGASGTSGTPVVGSLQIIFHVVYPETISLELCETLSSIL